MLLALILASATVAFATPANAATEALLVHGSAYGEVLFDGDGFVLYAVTKDRKGKSRCYGACAKAWPPYVVDAKPSAAAGADAGRIGVRRRRNGDLQATYGGRPLYYWVGDNEPGDIFCQDVFEYGGRWLVVGPSGKLVT
jgi:predicted lipoprotein with Yx(FWY)xxD motif